MSWWHGTAQKPIREAEKRSPYKWAESKISHRKRNWLYYITMWSGSEDPDVLNHEAINYLPEIRELLLAGRNLEAQKLMYTHFVVGGQGSAFGNGKDTPFGCFLEGS